MGVFSVKMTIWNPTQPSRTEDVEAMVDTGASYSWISRSRLEGLGVHPTRRVTFQTIEGRMIERELAPVFVRFDGYTGGDTVVLAEASDHEVWGALTLDSLGLAPDPVKKVLVPTVGFALHGFTAMFHRRRSRIVEAIESAISEGRLTEPFSNAEFRHSCPGFGAGTYNAFLWKHSRGNPGR